MARPDALTHAETRLVDHGEALTRDEVAAVAALPLDALPDLVALAHRVRLACCGPTVELESLINAKSGACPEDCAFCSQSARFHTDVDVYPFLDLGDVVEAARATRAAGATQFCIVVTVRNPEERLLQRVLDAVAAIHAETGLEVACSLGLLEPSQAARLAEAGVRRYNHNLETCRAVFPSICTTHTYDDRVETARLATAAGMELCCGGILGLGMRLLVPMAARRSHRIIVPAHAIRDDVGRLLNVAPDKIDVVHEGIGTSKRAPPLAEAELRSRLGAGAWPIVLSVSAKRPLVLVEMLANFDVLANVSGGGVSAQADAVKMGISRALLEFNVELRKTLKADGLLSRDARIKERKKYGQKGARKRFQFSKR